MHQTLLKTHILITTIALAFCSTTTLAQDISNEQRNAYEARQTLNEKKSAHESLVTRTAQQEKRVQIEQDRLAKLRTDQQAAKVELDQAEVDLDAKVNALNNVWDLRDK